MGVGLEPPSGHRSAAPSSTSVVNSLCGRGGRPASIRRLHAGRNNKAGVGRDPRSTRWSSPDIAGRIRTKATSSRAWLAIRWMRLITSRARFRFPSTAGQEVGEWDVCFGGTAPLDRASAMARSGSCLCSHQDVAFGAEAEVGLQRVLFPVYAESGHLMFMSARPSQMAALHQRRGSHWPPPWQRPAAARVWCR